MRTLMTVLTLIHIGAQSYSQKKMQGHLSITPGIDFSTMRAQDAYGNHVDFPDGTNFRIGADFEIPISSGKWAIMIEPTLQRYTAKSPNELIYRSLEVPAGVRRYFAVNKNAGFFINGAVVADAVLTHTIRMAPNLYFRSSQLRANFAAGIGVALNRFTIEYRYYTQRNRQDTGSFIYNFNKRSLIIGFRLH